MPMPTLRRSRRASVALVVLTAAIVATLAAGDPASDAVGLSSNELRTPLGATTATSAPRSSDASPPSAPGAAPTIPDQSPIEIEAAQSDDVPVAGQLTELLRRYFGPATVEAIVIVQCESGFDVLAYNENTDGTADHGLFQINDVHKDSFEPITGRPWNDRYDPETNVVFARWLWGHSQGWGPWRCNTRLDGPQFDTPADSDS